MPKVPVTKPKEPKPQSEAPGKEEISKEGLERVKGTQMQLLEKIKVIKEKVATGSA